MEKADDLLPQVYDQLKKLAQHRMAKERQGHTLQSTALVHEAYLRLVGNGDPGWVNEAQFFKAAAEAMRRLLIDHARKRGRVKRGGDRRRAAISVADLAANEDPEEILALEEAIQRLEEIDPRQCRVVELRHFAGLSVEETAEALDVSRATVKRDWRVAKLWLCRELEATSGP